MKSEELDQILDQALATYSRQEPRAGLAARVMALVRTDRAALRDPWFIFAIAALGLASLAIVVWLRQPEAAKVVTSVQIPPRARHEEPPRSSVRVTKVHRKPLPRRETFPIATPLTPQEQALIAFARQAPQAAFQVSRSHAPLEIEPIEIRPLEIDGLPIPTGEGQ